MESDQLQLIADRLETISQQLELVVYLGTAAVEALCWILAGVTWRLLIVAKNQRHFW